MDVRNCKSCGKLYNHIEGVRVCPACAQKMDDKFHVVKEYIRDNKKASLNMISEENEVSIPQIKQWIREERLVFTEDSLVGIECENCGTMIRTGRFCKSCKDSMANQMHNVVKEKEMELEEKRRMRENISKDVMRFLDNYEK